MMKQVKRLFFKTLLFAVLYMAFDLASGYMPTTSRNDIFIMFITFGIFDIWIKEVDNE